MFLVSIAAPLLSTPVLEGTTKVEKSGAFLGGHEKRVNPGKYVFGGSKNTPFLFVQLSCGRARESSVSLAIFTKEKNSHFPTKLQLSSWC